MSTNRREFIKGTAWMGAAAALASTNVACASTKLCGGKITVEWTRKDGKIEILIDIDGNIEAKYQGTPLFAGKNRFGTPPYPHLRGKHFQRTQ